MKMKDELIGINEIYLQDVVCSVVSQNPLADDFVLYNIIASIVDIPSFETTDRVLALIKLNKTALIN
jgi:hypothetical protein